MKIIVRISALLLCAALFLPVLTGCGGGNDEEAVKAGVARFESALQAGDAEQILGAIDPKIAGPIKKVMEMTGLDPAHLTETITGVFGADVLEKLKPDETESGIMEALRSVSVTPSSYKFGAFGDRCTVGATFAMNVGGAERSVEGALTMIRRDGVWYVGLL